MKEWREKNREREIQRLREWRKNNREKFNEYQSKRRKKSAYFHRENPCVYSITNTETGEILRIGSTSNTLNIRKTVYANRAFHKRDNSLVSIYIRGNYDDYQDALNNLVLMIIEELPKDCTKEYRLRREQFHMDKHNPILNQRRAIAKNKM